MSTFESHETVEGRNYVSLNTLPYVLWCPAGSKKGFIGVTASVESLVYEIFASSEKETNLSVLLSSVANCGLIEVNSFIRRPPTPQLLQFYTILRMPRDAPKDFPLGYALELQGPQAPPHRSSTRPVT